jgi:SAM-dependent methyltransferase
VSPLLEREAELAALDAAVAAAREGRGSVVLLAGEAGIGKTSLVRELVARAGVPVHVGRCEPLTVPARKRIPGARIEIGDVQFLPFEDESFDVVTGYNSFQYAADPHAALLEARRVLRPDGRLLVATWGRADQCETGAVLGAVGGLLPPPPPGTPGPFALAEDGALETLLDSAGFDTEEVFDVDTPYCYPDEATFVRALGSAGPCVKAARTVGDEKLAAVMVEAGAPYRQDDGSYRFENVFRLAIARVR